MGRIQEHGGLKFSPSVNIFIGESGSGKTEILTSLYRHRRHGSAAFIPSMDMMPHTKGFASLYDQFRIDFEQEHRDLVGYLVGPERRWISRELEAITLMLESSIGGSVRIDGERLFLLTAKGRIPMPEVAEGFRRIATLVRLIDTGGIGEGSILLWDLPENGLHPKLIGKIAQAIVLLSKAGVQIFLATHSDALVCEIAALAEADVVQVISLPVGFKEEPQ